MAEGITCYERDEVFCEDQWCLRVGCILRNKRLVRAQLAEARKALEDVAARARFELDHPTPLRDTAFSFMLIRFPQTNAETY